MRTQTHPTLIDWFNLRQADGRLQRAQAELLKCVHCGMCNATCPTYQITGDELDGPRGRLYQVRAMMEGAKVEESHRYHLDRCLQCRACETTCPSGVGYHHVLEVGREWVAAQLPPQNTTALLRKGLTLLAYRRLNDVVWPLARVFRPLLPPFFKKKIPPLPPTSARAKSVAPLPKGTTSYLLMQGCVQPGMLPNIHQATENVLAQVGINLVRIPEENCCGALPYHVGHEEKALPMIRDNIQRWQAYWAANAECAGLMVNASGCGLMVRDYPQVLSDHGADELLEAAKNVAARSFEPMEILTAHTANLAALLKKRPPPATRVVFQAPCTLQHGLKLQNQVENWLSALFAGSGVTLIPVAEPHLCCGSAGTYSIQQPELSQQLRANKWANLTRDQPERILTANVGCHSHLQGAGDTPVQHYLEFLAEWLGGDLIEN